MGRLSTPLRVQFSDSQVRIQCAQLARWSFDLMWLKIPCGSKPISSLQRMQKEGIKAGKVKVQAVRGIHKSRRF